MHATAPVARVRACASSPRRASASSRARGCVRWPRRDGGSGVCAWVGAGRACVRSRRRESACGCTRIGARWRRARVRAAASRVAIRARRSGCTAAVWAWRSCGSARARVCAPLPPRAALEGWGGGRAAVRARRALLCTAARGRPRGARRARARAHTRWLGRTVGPPVRQLCVRVPTFAVSAVAVAVVAQPEVTVRAAGSVAAVDPGCYLGAFVVTESSTTAASLRGCERAPRGGGEREGLCATARTRRERGEWRRECRGVHRHCKHPPPPHRRRRRSGVTATGEPPPVGSSTHRGAGMRAAPPPGSHVDVATAHAAAAARRDAGVSWWRPGVVLAARHGLAR